MHARRERPNYHRLIFNPEPFSPTIDGSSFLILRARLLPLFQTISNSFRLLGLVITGTCAREAKIQWLLRTLASSHLNSGCIDLE